jgi:hypothetical protein
VLATTTVMEVTSHLSGRNTHIFLDGLGPMVTKMLASH